MKRLFAVITAVAFVFSVFSATLPASAAKASPAFSAPTLTVRPGDTVEVPVSVSGDYAAHGLHLRLVFSNSELILEGYTRGPVLNDVSAHGGMAIVESKVENGNNSIRLGVMMPNEPFSATGVLFTARLTIAPGVANGTIIPLDVRVNEFIYMPIGVPQQNITHSVTSGRLIVSGSGSTPSPTPRPTDTPSIPTPSPSPSPSATPTASPGTPTAPPSAPPTPTPSAPPSSAPETPYPRPSAPPTPTPTPRPSATPTPRPSTTPTPRPSATPAPRPSTTPAFATPPAAHSAAPQPPTPNNSSSPNAPDDPFARFSAAPASTYEASPTPDGIFTSPPTARLSPSPDESSNPFETVEPYDGIAPFDTIAPSDDKLPEVRSPRLGFGLLALIGLSTAAAGVGVLLFARKHQRNYEDS